MARLREDARFKAVGPDTLVVDVAVDEGGIPALVVGESATDGEGEIWMDWAFVEFWKESYCKLTWCPLSGGSLTRQCVPQTQSRSQ